MREEWWLQGPPGALYQPQKPGRASGRAGAPVQVLHLGRLGGAMGYEHRTAALRPALPAPPGAAQGVCRAWGGENRRRAMRAVQQDTSLSGGCAPPPPPAPRKWLLPWACSLAACTTRLQPARSASIADGWPATARLVGLAKGGLPACCWSCPPPPVPFQPPPPFNRRRCRLQPPLARTASASSPTACSQPSLRHLTAHSLHSAEGTGSGSACGDGRRRLRCHGQASCRPRDIKGRREALLG